MSGQASLNLPRKSFVAVLLVLIWTLFSEAWLETWLVESGHSIEYVGFYAKLVILPFTVGLVWLIVSTSNAQPVKLFIKKTPGTKLIVFAVMVGVLLRVAWWAQLTARISFGITSSSDPDVRADFSAAFVCPDWQLIVLAGLVWIIWVPVTEEFVHRGVIQGALSRKGPNTAILVSSVLFALVHSPDNFVWVFVVGAALGLLYWVARTLWIPIVSHATYDGLIIFDRLCLQLNWNPSGGNLPLLVQGFTAILVFTGCVLLILKLIYRVRAERDLSPDPGYF